MPTDWRRLSGGHGPPRSVTIMDRSRRTQTLGDGGWPSNDVLPMENCKHGLPTGRATRASLDLAARGNAGPYRRRPQDWSETCAKRNVAWRAVRSQAASVSAPRATTLCDAAGGGRKRRWATSDGRGTKHCGRRICWYLWCQKVWRLRQRPMQMLVGSKLTA